MNKDSVILLKASNIVGQLKLHGFLLLLMYLSIFLAANFLHPILLMVPVANSMLFILFFYKRVFLTEDEVTEKRIMSRNRSLSYAEINHVLECNGQGRIELQGPEGAKPVYIPHSLKKIWEIRKILAERVKNQKSFELRRRFSVDRKMLIQIWFGLIAFVLIVLNDIMSGRRVQTYIVVFMVFAIFKLITTIYKITITADRLLLNTGMGLKVITAVDVEKVIFGPVNMNKNGLFVQLVFKSKKKSLYLGNFSPDDSTLYQSIIHYFCLPNNIPTFVQDKVVESKR